MAIKPIAKMGQPILLERALALAADRDIAPALAADLVDTMVDAGGIGLAAPQIFVGLRAIAFEVPETVPDPIGRVPRAPGSEAVPPEEGEGQAGAPLGTGYEVLLNPEVVFLSDEREIGWEGCLSIPGLRGEVPRCPHIRYTGIRPDGTRVEREAKALHARVVQHEMDHLDGILFPTRMTDLTTLIFDSEFEAFLGRQSE